MKKFLTLLGCIVLLQSCTSITAPLPPLAEDTSRAFAIPFDFTVGIYTNNAGLAIPNVIMQQGKTYFLYRSFAKDTSLMCSNVSGDDYCISNNGLVLGIKDIEMQKKVARSLVQRIMLRQNDLTTEATKIPSEKLGGGLNFSNPALVPGFLKTAGLTENIIPLEACFEKSNATIKEIACYGQSYMPYYMQTSTSTGSTLNIIDSVFFMSTDTLSQEKVKEILGTYKK